MNTSKQSNISNLCAAPLLKLSGSNFFRLKIAYSILLQKPVEISNIRSNSINPGLTEYEVSFLKLVERITNGTKIEISKTGTILKFYPGVITNNYGDILEFQCDNSRCLTYYLEGIIPISLYGKESLQIILKGVTNNDQDISVDTFKNVTCPLLAKCVIGDKVEFDIQKRGVLPLGNGQIKFKCPIITFLNNFEWADEGKIRRIRGVAFTCRVPGSFSTRMIDACRGVFNNFLPDVWIAVDNFKSKNKEEM
jgi:RNA 3'-terminal phosphate cyclase-like protein